jgi:quercetin dioxygenase-like cupin family protein
MKKFNLEDMHKGWFVGNFEPAVFKTELFEVGTTFHPKGSSWDLHYHKKGTEITWLISGKMKIQETIVEAGEIFLIPPYEIADPEFLEDCRVLVIKTPSDTNDKYSVIPS